MTIRRITISVPEATASRIKKAAGQAPVSAWVTDLIEEHLEGAELERKWREFYEETRPSQKDVSRAEALHQRLTKTAGRKGVA
jgi:hypothetical protein